MHKLRIHISIKPQIMINSAEVCFDPSWAQKNNYSWLQKLSRQFLQKRKTIYIKRFTA
jgi:hypothetical protein